MANVIRLKRRAAGGAAGAPAALKTTEAAFNEQDGILYLGFGDDGSGNATSIIAIAGSGAFVPKAGNYTIDGVKTFSSSPVAPTPTTGDSSTKVATTAFVQDAVGEAGGGDMMSATYDPQGVSGDAFARANHTGTQSADTLTDGTSNKAYTAGEKTKLAGIEAAADVTDAGNVGAAIAGAAAKATPVAADRFALTDSEAGNALKYMTYSNLSAAIVAILTDSAPGTLDTLNELAAALADDPNFASTMTTALAAKAPLASPDFTGTPTAPTAATATDTTQLATTAFVHAAIAAATIDGGTF